MAMPLYTTTLAAWLAGLTRGTEECGHCHVPARCTPSLIGGSGNPRLAGCATAMAGGKGRGLVGGGWSVGNGEESERVLVGSGDNSPSVFEVGERQCSHYQ